MTSCSCLCGEIEFEVEVNPMMTFNCHCDRCKQSHGAAYATQVMAKKSSLSFIKGKESLSEYKSEKAIRSFCSKCGSRLMNSDTGKGNYLSVAVSTIQDKKVFKPIGECFVGKKLDFVVLNPSIPHFEAIPEIPL